MILHDRKMSVDDVSVFVYKAVTSENDYFDLKCSEMNPSDELSNQTLLC